MRLPASCMLLTRDGWQPIEQVSGAVLGLPRFDTHSVDALSQGKEHYDEFSIGIEEAAAPEHVLYAFPKNCDAPNEWDPNTQVMSMLPLKRELINYPLPYGHITTAEDIAVNKQSWMMKVLRLPLEEPLLEYKRGHHLYEEALGGIKYYMYPMRKLWNDKALGDCTANPSIDTNFIIKTDVNPKYLEVVWTRGKYTPPVWEETVEYLNKWLAVCSYKLPLHGWIKDALRGVRQLAMCAGIPMHVDREHLCVQWPAVRIDTIDSGLMLDYTQWYAALRKHKQEAEFDMLWKRFREYQQFTHFTESEAIANMMLLDRKTEMLWPVLYRLSAIPGRLGLFWTFPGMLQDFKYGESKQRWWYIQGTKKRLIYVMMSNGLVHLLQL